METGVLRTVLSNRAGSVTSKGVKLSVEIHTLFCLMSVKILIQKLEMAAQTSVEQKKAGNVKGCLLFVPPYVEMDYQLDKNNVMTETKTQRMPALILAKSTPSRSKSKLLKQSTRLQRQPKQFKEWSQWRPLQVPFLQFYPSVLLFSFYQPQLSSNDPLP